jgi:hypothetical protein
LIGTRNAQVGSRGFYMSHGVAQIVVLPQRRTDQLL